MKRPHTHPGRILRETVLPEAGLSVAEAAQALDEPEMRLRLVLEERLPLNAELCLKIAAYFDSSPEMWIRLQASYDLQQARLDETIAASIRRIIPATPFASAVA